MEITVESAYKEPAYKELPVIRNWFYFPELYQGTSSLHVYKELRLKEQFFMGPMGFLYADFTVIILIQFKRT